MWEPPDPHPLRRLFAGYTEHTFEQTFGVADPPLVDYLSTLLSRFIHADALYCFKDSTGRPLDQVADMMAESAGLPRGRTTREIHRHIGDFALFWTGVFPEGLRQLKSPERKDYFVDYCEQGKKSYFIASTFDEDEFHDEAVVLRRISERFELCAYGLNQVRLEWEHDHAEPIKPRLIG